MHLIRFIFFALLGLSLISPGASAEEKLERFRFWGGIDIGVGFVHRSFEGIEEDESNFFLGFKAGYTLNSHFLIGIELSGWLLESSDLEDPSKGEGISQAFLITRYYPNSSMRLFAKIGGGYVSYWNNRPGEPSRKDGWGLTFGGGYDFPLKKNLAITPFINYGFGEADDQDHNVWTLGIGEWNIDPAHSGVYFDVRHIFATVRGQFDDYTAKFIFDPESNDTSSCEFEVKVKSINTNINQRDTHLRSEDFFAAKKFPTMTFKSTRINHIEGNQFEIVGNLTVKDVTKKVRVPFTYFAVKDKPTKPDELVAGFEGKFTIDRLEYNVGNGNFYKMGLVGKDVHITISLEVLKKK